MDHDETEALLRYRWASIDARFNAETVTAWAEQLADVPQLLARRAVVELIRQGHKPGLPQILEAVAGYQRVARERAPAPTLDLDPVVDAAAGRRLALAAVEQEMRRRGRSPAQIAAHVGGFTDWAG